MEEINLLDYIKILKKQWRIWVFTFVFAEIVVLISSLMLPKRYESSATILPPELTMDTGRTRTTGIPSILREQIPGLSGQATLSTLIVAMLKSKTMSIQVANRFDINRREVTTGTAISQSKEGLIIVKVSSSNPRLAMEIADFYIANLDSMNEELKVSSDKPIVTVLDPPLLPTTHSSPNIVLNLLIGGVFSLFIGVLMAFFVNYIQSIKDHE